MTKKFFTLLVCFITLNALAISEKQAALVTQNFLKERNILRENSLSQFSLKQILKKEDTETFYIMSLGNDEGFVIVSASEYLPPIFAYSFENQPEENPAVRFYLDIYSDFILKEKSAKNQPNEEYTKEWEHYLSENFTPKRLAENAVAPLITSRWNQNKFYNTYCPWDSQAIDGFDGRVPNGCVALAGAQLMNYYRHPESGRYIYSYKPMNYPIQTIYPSQQKYNWDAMCDNVTNYTNEIAKLAHHLGVTVKMGYAPGGSGAYTEDLTTALSANFGYTSAEIWSNNDAVKFVKELDLKRPILMDGCTPANECHAFIMDGYDNSEIRRFNFNWGWGGGANGYFLLDQQFFNASGHTHLGIRPSTSVVKQCEQLKIQNTTEGYITNGSTNKPYQSAPDCSWLIAAPGASQYSFSFSRLDTQEDIDVVTIYKGSTKSSGVAATFSGTKTPAGNTNVHADSVLITFTSTNPDAQNATYTGFLMNYITNKPPQKCETATTIKTTTGFLTDGSQPDENYSPWSSCTWNFAPDNGIGLFCLFHEFNLALGDFVEFYDPATDPLTLLYRFDKNSPPTIGEVISFSTPKTLMMFISDNYEQGKGFKLQYFSLLGINNNSLLDNLTIFPNPASDYVNVAFSSELVNKTVNCSIVDVTGKEVHSLNIDYQGDVSFTQIPISHLSKGIYFLHLTTSAGKITSKIIKN